jgi:hypothetical protein
MELDVKNRRTQWRQGPRVCVSDIRISDVALHLGDGRFHPGGSLDYVMIWPKTMKLTVSIDGENHEKCFVSGGPIVS